MGKMVVSVFRDPINLKDSVLTQKKRGQKYFNFLMASALSACASPGFSDTPAPLHLNVSLPAALVAADLDGDGLSDLAFAGAWPNVGWARNLGGGRFGGVRAVTSLASGAAALAAGDVDGDGHLDLVSASVNDGKLAWYKNVDGDGTFGDQIVVQAGLKNSHSSWSFDVALGDLDNDGDLDIALASYGDKKIMTFENTDGKGAFVQNYSTYAGQPSSIRLGDVDGDGTLDMVGGMRAWSSMYHVDVYFNRRGSFEAHAIRASSLPISSMALGDVDGSGTLDIAVGDSFVLQWYDNTGGGRFPGAVRAHTVSSDPHTSTQLFSDVVLADFDKDGALDLATSSNFKLSFFQNADGKGTFSTQVNFGGLQHHARSLAVADFDGDGWLDVATASSATTDNPITYHANTCGPSAPSSVDNKPVDYVNVTNVLRGLI